MIVVRIAPAAQGGSHGSHVTGRVTGLAASWSGPSGDVCDRHSAAFPPPVLGASMQSATAMPVRRLTPFGPLRLGRLKGSMDVWPEHS